jgi:hypothetical protein
MELIHDIHQQKKHGTKAQDGENIGEENDIRIFGDGKNSRDGIDGENKVGKFNDQQHQEKWCHQSFTIYFNKKPVAFKLWIYREIFGGKLYYSVIFRVDFFLLVTGYIHPDAGINQKNAKNV